MPNAGSIELLEFRQRGHSCRLKELLEEEGIELHLALLIDEELEEGGCGTLGETRMTGIRNRAGEVRSCLALSGV